MQTETYHGEKINHYKMQLEGAPPAKWNFSLDVNTLKRRARAGVSKGWALFVNM
jgi:hypothetical protein